MAGLVKETPTLPKDIIRTYLPREGLEVYAKRMENESYRLVTDLRSGDVYGNPFWLKGNRLARFTEPASFTEEQNARLKRLAKEIDPDQIFVVEPNLNANAYGSGKVMSVAEKGKETKYFITINGHTVPVRVTPIEEHGVRYDVVDGEKIYPVNFNGKEWYFEPATSPFVSKKLADEVMKNMDEFESIKDPSVLSGPDEQTLMWNKYGRSYIKINDHYIPLIQLYKNWDWYHLVKKDIQQPMTVLIFEPENELFRLETSLDKRLREGERLKQVEAGSSQGISRQTGQEVELPPVGDLPDPPGRGEEWNEFRNVQDIEVEVPPVSIDEDTTVRMDSLTRFLPEPRIYVYNHEDVNKYKILEFITGVFSKEPPLPYRVYKSLKLSNKPDFLKPFVLELIKDYKKAQERFQKTLEVCQNVLTKGRIAETPQGEYLVKMFRLESAVNQEQILLEIVQRLISISRKGMEFLQKTADWGYENILIASSELVKQPGSKEYISASQNSIAFRAFIFPTDPECRIIFLADSFYLNPDFDKGGMINSGKSRTLMHETTHLVAKTVDVAKYYRETIGIKKTGKMVLEEYQKQRSRIFFSDGFKKFVKHIERTQNKPGLALTTVWQETIKSDLLRANLQMSDADMVAFIIKDLAEGRNFEGVLREARSLKDSTIEDESIFIFLAVAVNTYAYGNFARDLELDKDQEQEQSTETIAVTNESDHPTTVKREKREVASTTKEPPKNISKQSFLELVTTGIIRSYGTVQVAYGLQIKPEFPKVKANRSSLNLLTPSTVNSNRMSQLIPTQPMATKTITHILTASRERSDKINQPKVFNQQNKQELERNRNN
ncbi:hypothetical protein A5844_000235 [Enterococcus sp. 10A9_DIV0425]|uniref:Uncharacterized protein n=2 Tax=Candidatus Enterococcus wittei TaxID=1987383 RepID=A0A2C9XPB8_9ENTE|nr:hypothetical protein A5844_000235 [Enterococcus sp. 10A9_DIV0425]